MTALEKFFSTAKGLAVGTVLTAVLYGPAHDAMKRHVEDSFSAEAQAGKPVSYQGGGAFEGTAAEAVRLLDRRIEILIEAQDRLSARNTSLANDIEVLASLHEEMVAVVPDPSRMEPRQHLDIIGEVLDNLMAQQEKDLSEGGSKPLGILVSASTPDLAETIQDKEHRLRELAKAINEWSAENERVEAILAQMVAELDVLFTVARDPSSEVDEGYEAWERFTVLLEGYLEPVGREVPEVVRSVK